MTSDDPASGAAYTRFIVLSGPRTGSTLLADALNSSPDIVCFGEIFNPASRDDIALRAAQPAEYLSTRIFGPYPDNVRAVGFKFHYYQFWGFPGLRELLETDEDLLVIHLERRNLLRVLVSDRIAVKTGVYLKPTRMRPRVIAMIRGVLLKRTLPSRTTVSISPADCREFLMKRAMNAKHWGKIFAMHQTLPVLYEEMTADLQQEFARVQSFIGVTPATLKVRLARQNPQRLEELIENFTELRDAFLGTPAEWMFDD